MEEAARTARYGFLGQLARQIGAHSIAVGHQADDQAETVLMHLLRGAGLAGLGGIRPLSWLDEERPESVNAGTDMEAGRLRLVRPLLGVTREQLRLYATAEGLVPLMDPSNADRTFFRNRLRHELLPLLETYNPSIRAVLCRTAEALAGDHELLQIAVQEAWEATVLSSDPEMVLYDRAVLAALPLPMQQALLRRGVQCLRRSLRDLSWTHVADATAVLGGGHVGQRATLPGGLQLTLGYDRVMLAAAGTGWPPADCPRLRGELILSAPGTCTLLNGGWRVVSEVVDRTDLPVDWRKGPTRYHAWLDADCLAWPLRLRARRAGDRLMPLGMQGSQSVKELMVNCKVPAHERGTLPILECATGLVWVAGLRLDRRFSIVEGTSSVLHIWFEPLPGAEEEQ